MVKGARAHERDIGPMLQQDAILKVDCGVFSKKFDIEDAILLDGEIAINDVELDFVTGVTCANRPKGCDFFRCSAAKINYVPVIDLIRRGDAVKFHEIRGCSGIYYQDRIKF